MYGIVERSFKSTSMFSSDVSFFASANFMSMCVFPFFTCTSGRRSCSPRARAFSETWDKI